VLVEDGGVPAELVDDIVLPDYVPATLPAADDLAATVRWLQNKRLIPADYESSLLLDTLNGVRLPQ
jgi:hypothetical protein